MVYKPLLHKEPQLFHGVPFLGGVLGQLPRREQPFGPTSNFQQLRQVIEEGTASTNSASFMLLAIPRERSRSSAGEFSGGGNFFPNVGNKKPI